MNYSRKTLGLTAGLGWGLSSIAVLLQPVNAATFGQQEVNQGAFIVLATPRSTDAYNLLILEQLKDTRQCWRVNPDASQTVEPLLMNFDFTGICGRSTDSNAYSIRTAGEDQGLRYTLRLVPQANSVVLVGTPSNRSLPEIELGRTRGRDRAFMKIDLSPGWRLTRRTFQARALPHLYFTSNDSLDVIAARSGTVVAPSPSPTPVASPQPTPRPSPTPVASPQPTPRPSPTPVASPQPTPRPSPTPVASPQPTPRPTTTQVYEAQVRQIYRSVLGREADAPGLAYHVKRMLNGRSLALVQRDIENSPEGRRVAIARLHREMMGREIDPPLLDFYTQQMGTMGWTLEQVRRDLESRRAAMPPETATPAQPSGPTTQPGIRPVDPTPAPTARESPTTATAMPVRIAYYVVIPTSAENLPVIAQKAKQLGIAEVNILQRRAPLGPHLAIGPFLNRGLAEQWNSFMRNAGMDARVYYGE